MTNYERIKAMSVDELASFFCNIITEVEAEDPCAICPARKHCRYGHTGMKDWLESEVAEDE
jgi:hypothetical protein